MLSDGRPIHDLVARRQVHRIAHEGVHERIEELLGSVGGEGVEVLDGAGGHLDSAGQRRELVHGLSRQKLKALASLDALLDQLGFVVPALGALEHELVRGGKVGEYRAKVPQHVLGTEVVTLGVVHLQLQPLGPDQLEQHVEEHVDQPGAHLFQQEQVANVRVGVEPPQHLKGLVAEGKLPPDHLLVLLVSAGDRLPLLLAQRRPLLRIGHLDLHPPYLGKLFHHRSDEGVRLVHDAVGECDEGIPIGGNLAECGLVLRRLPQIPQQTCNVRPVLHSVVVARLLHLSVQQ
mmetsp:Transcript_19386/g.36237  ORF Transcript_19386/g.36237 Transcript_19386/m.36237 type:complete len:290 (-) Transcript_19386:348-1217(-)